MAAKKKAKKKAARKTSKKTGARSTRKTPPRRGAGALPLPTAETPKPATGEAAAQTGDPLRRPVLLFTATTLLVFAAIYYIYGPCSSFSRFPRPAVAPPDSTPRQVEERVTPVQSLPDAASIENLRLSYSKKKSDIDPQLEASLDAVSRFLDENPAAKLDIIGHTCNIGQHPDNDRLSMERADAVRDALIARGVARRRMAAIGRGEREPIASNSSDAGRIRNRRVEFRVSQ